MQKHRRELCLVNVTIKVVYQLYLSISIRKTNWTADIFQNLLCEATPESVKLDAYDIYGKKRERSK